MTNALVEAQATMTEDEALVAGIMASPDFITVEPGKDNAVIEAMMKPESERDGIDNMLIDMFTPPTPAEQAELDAREAAYKAERDAEIAEMEARLKYREDHKCRKCGGGGRLPHYNYIANGMCFRCDGTGVYVPSHLRNDI